MAELSDISPAVENMQICFFYIVGTISFLVETFTLYIIITKGSLLTTEFRFLTIFQQLLSHKFALLISCLLSTAFITILYIPFFYTKIGGGYCMGVLCLFVPYEYMLIIQVFLTSTKFAAFGMMIIARHQMLLMDNSFLKVKPAIKYVSFIVLLCALQGVTVISVISAVVSDRRKQIENLRSQPQLKWLERGLNWFLFDGLSSPNLMNVAFYSNIFLLPAIFALIVLPFAHMFRIVTQSRKTMQSQAQHRTVHIQQARTIIIQCIVLLGFFLFPFIAPAIATQRDNIYADTQTLIVISEMVFVCSTLCNSIVIVSRNHAYRAAVIGLYGSLALSRASSSRTDSTSSARA